MHPIKSLTTFCGSGAGNDPRWMKLAHDWGQICGENEILSCYGGGSVGLMGGYASSAMSHGGRVVGVIPGYLIGKERPFDWLRRAPHELIVTETMAQRKWHFDRFAEIYVALPGGQGTLDEITEVLTHEQVGQNRKPLIIVNPIRANGTRYWDNQFAMWDVMREEGFIRPGLEFRQIVVHDVHEVLPAAFAALDESSEVVLPHDSTVVPFARPASA